MHTNDRLGRRHVTCPVCGSSERYELENRSCVPVLQNRVWPDRASARRAPTAELRLVLCPVCGFAHNELFDSKLVSYNDDYDNQQVNSPRYVTHLDEMVARVNERASVDARRLMEVGCGQGQFLSRLSATGRFSSLIGFDPAWQEMNEIPGAIIHKRMFELDSSRLDKSPDVVVSRHTIEHVACPVAFLCTLKKGMVETGPRSLFLETPDLEWILQNGQVQDLFYEHCSLFSEASLRLACAAAGFEVETVAHVFGGQYLWVEAIPREIGEGLPKLLPAQGEIDKLLREADAFRTLRTKFLVYWKSLVQDLSHRGNVWVWGAASKGVTFALLVDPDATILAGAVDLNTSKVGHYMPISGLPIVGPENVSDLDSVIVMNPNYEQEIAACLSRRNISAQIVSLRGPLAARRGL